MPSRINVSVKDTQSALFNLENVLKVTLDINDNGNEKNFYVIEAVRQRMYITSRIVNGRMKYDTAYANTYSRNSIYTSDPYTENVLTATFSTLNRRILYSDKNFNGMQYKADVYLPKYYPIDTFYGTREQTILLVKSVSEDYYNFLKAYEQYEPLSGFNTSNAPVKLEGNVLNGMGMIGAVSQKKFYYMIEQPF